MKCLDGTPRRQPDQEAGVPGESGLATGAAPACVGSVRAEVGLLSASYATELGRTTALKEKT